MAEINKLDVAGIGTEDYTSWPYAKTPQKAIKEFCRQCMGDSYDEVKHCSSSICPLKPYRTGKNPFRAVVEMSEERREASAKRLREARENRNIEGGLL